MGAITLFNLTLKSLKKLRASYKNALPVLCLDNVKKMFKDL